MEERVFKWKEVQRNFRDSKVLSTARTEERLSERAVLFVGTAFKIHQPGYLETLVRFFKL